MEVFKALLAGFIVLAVAVLAAVAPLAPLVLWDAPWGAFATCAIYWLEFALAIKVKEEK